MRSNDFSGVGYIDTRLEPDFELIDGREIETIGFQLITEDNLRFECQTDTPQIAWRKLQGIDTARLYRCKGYFQRIEGYQVFIVEDLNLSTSVPSGTGPRVCGNWNAAQNRIPETSRKWNARRYSHITPKTIFGITR